MMTKTPTFYLFLLCSLSLLFSSCESEKQASDIYDLVVYGGTSGGIATAIQAKRMGKSVILIEPDARIGGLTTGGLGQTDIGNKQAIGGFAREFYQGIKRYYDDPANWKFQAREEYKDGGQTRTQEGESAICRSPPDAFLDGAEGRRNKRIDRSDLLPEKRNVEE